MSAQPATRFAALAALALAAALAAGAGPGQRPDAERAPHPGRVDLGADSLFDRDDLKVHLTIEQAMLRLVAAATREKEPELAAMIEGLVAIEVRAFEIDAVGKAAVRRAIGDTAERLRREGWSPAVDIRLDDTRGFLFFRSRGDTVVGLAGMFAEDDGEAVFVNIVGEVDPALVGTLAARLNLSLFGHDDDRATPPAERPNRR